MVALAKFGGAVLPFDPDRSLGDEEHLVPAGRVRLCVIAVARLERPGPQLRFGGGAEMTTQDLLEAKQALSLAENVEQPSVVQEAASRKTTARSVGRSLVVGGLIGLILGLLAAILWEPAERRFRPRTA